MAKWRFGIIIRTWPWVPVLLRERSACSTPFAEPPCSVLLPPTCAPSTCRPSPTWTTRSCGPAPRIVSRKVSLTFSSRQVSTLFSFLFGIGFAIQMERADARGLQTAYFYLRRLTVLLAFGLLHGILLWWGDILAPYGDHGFRTLPFPPLVPAEDSLVGRRAYLYPLAITAGMVGLKGAGPGNDGLAAYQREGNGAHHRHLQRWSISPSSGRSRRVALQLLRTRFLLPPVSSAFSFRAFGSGREGILRGLKRTSGHATHVCARHGLWIGLLLNAAFVAVPRLPPQSDESPTVGGLCRCLFMSLGNPVLSLCYASTIALLWQEKRWRAAHERLRRRWANPRYRTSCADPSSAPRSITVGASVSSAEWPSGGADPDSRNLYASSMVEPLVDRPV